MNHKRVKASLPLGKLSRLKSCFMEASNLKSKAQAQHLRSEKSQFHHQIKQWGTLIRKILLRVKRAFSATMPLRLNWTSWKSLKAWWKTVWTIQRAALNLLKITIALCPMWKRKLKQICLRSKVHLLAAHLSIRKILMGLKNKNKSLILATKQSG